MAHQTKSGCNMPGFLLGYSYVPIQELNEVYCAEKGWRRGTIFPELDMPFGVYGNNFNQKFCSCSADDEGGLRDGK